MLGCKLHIPRSVRSLRKQTTMFLQCSVSSANSRSDTNPSLEPSGKRQFGTRIYRQLCHATVSHSTEVDSVNWRAKVRRRVSFVFRAFNNSSSWKSTLQFSISLIVYLSNSKRYLRVQCGSSQRADSAWSPRRGSLCWLRKQTMRHGAHQDHHRGPTPSVIQ